MTLFELELRDVEGEGALASQGFLTAKERAVRAVVGVIAAAACSSVLLLGAYLLALAARPDQGDVVTRFFSVDCNTCFFVDLGASPY